MSIPAIKPQDVATTTIEEGLKIYYHQFKKKYNGQLATFMNDNGYEEDDLLEDFENVNDLTECMIIMDFDEFFPLMLNLVDQNDLNAVMKAKWKIMKSCLDFGKPYIDLLKHTDLQLTSITSDDITQSIKLYRQQVPCIFTGFCASRDCVNLLAAGNKNNNYPLLQTINDSYCRYRFDAQYNGKDVPSFKEWLKITGWEKQLEKKEKKLSDKVQDGMKQFQKVFPPLGFIPNKFIGAVEISKIINCLASCTKFIKQMIFGEKIICILDGYIRRIKSISHIPTDICGIILLYYGVSNVLTPFQVNMSIDVSSEEYLYTDDDDPDDSDDQLPVDDDNIKTILTNNNCSFYAESIDYKIKEDISDLMMNVYKKFRSTLKTSKNKPPSATATGNSDRKHYHKSFNHLSYPSRKRFDILIDNEIIFFEAPYYCDTMPDGFYVPLWFLESSKQCLFPTDKSTDNFTTNKIMTFSFHVESQDKIKCYLWWNGSLHRFYPEDIIKVFKYIFSKYQYDTFINNCINNNNKNNNNNIHQKINICDKQFEYFYNNLHSNIASNRYKNLLNDYNVLKEKSSHNQTNISKTEKTKIRIPDNNIFNVSSDQWVEIPVIDYDNDDHWQKEKKKLYLRHLI